jgi:hypothetical protein
MSIVGFISFATIGGANYSLPYHRISDIYLNVKRKKSCVRVTGDATEQNAGLNLEHLRAYDWITRDPLTVNRGDARTSGSEIGSENRDYGRQQSATLLQPTLRKQRNEQPKSCTHNPKVAGSNPAPATTYEMWGRKWRKPS